MACKVKDRNHTSICLDDDLDTVEGSVVGITEGQYKRNEQRPGSIVRCAMDTFGDTQHIISHYS